MPVVKRHGRMHFIGGDDLTEMSKPELAEYMNYVKACLTKLPDSPVLQEKLAAIEREVRWRTEDFDVK